MQRDRESRSPKSKNPCRVAAGHPLCGCTLRTCEPEDGNKQLTRSTPHGLPRRGHDRHRGPQTLQSPMRAPVPGTSFR